MNLDQLPKAKTEMIDASRANSFLHKGAKYTLFGAFFSATMHKGYSNCQPTFEVSIGTNVYPCDEAQRLAFNKPKSEQSDHYYSLKWEGQPIIQVSYPPFSLSLSLPPESVFSLPHTFSLRLTVNGKTVVSIVLNV